MELWDWCTYRMQKIGLCFTHTPIQKKKKKRTQASSVIFAFFSLQTRPLPPEVIGFLGVAAMWR